MIAKSITATTLALLCNLGLATTFSGAYGCLLKSDVSGFENAADPGLTNSRNALWRIDFDANTIETQHLFIANAGGSNATTTGETGTMDFSLSTGPITNTQIISVTYDSTTAKMLITPVNSGNTLLLSLPYDGFFDIPTTGVCQKE